MNANDALRLPPAEVLTMASHELRRSQALHWTALAVLVGRIEDEQLYLPTYATTRACCADELGLPPGDTTEGLRYWRMLEAALSQHGVGITEWATVPKARAALLRRALALGGDPKAWLTRARLATSTEALQAEVDRLTGKERWVTWALRLPPSTVELVEQALVVAIPQVDESGGVEVAQDPGKRHALLEEIVRHYVTCEHRRHEP